MASQKNFAITPSVSISRSKFRRPSQHKTAFNLGDIVPIYCDADILPGDTISMNLGALVRMSNPIVPIMDNIHIDYYAFFVPNRIVWDDWKQFMGENTSSFGAASEPVMPTCKITGSNTGLTTGCLGDYLGLPIVSSDIGKQVSVLPGRAYLTIYNEWFRDQNLISPYAVSKNSGNFNKLGVDPVSSSNLFYSMSLCKAAKDSDYFTRALPYAQKGSPVSLPLGNNAPLKQVSGATGNFKFINGTTSSVHLSGGEALESVSGDVPASGSLSKPFAVNGVSNMTVGVNEASLVADLSNATAATINQLRFAFQYQKFLEKDALYGTRYWEILKGHFGITAPDASLQRPELLGHFRQHINIDQVLQTTGSDVSDPSQNTLGLPGANSVSGKSDHIISKSFVEHGILMIVAVARHDQTYGQGINRMWTRVHRTDYYFPVFANLGAQEITNKEIYFEGSTPDGTFGYQEAWAEYRYKPSQVSGILNPSVANSLGFWTLANNFGSKPTLSKSFIEQDRGNLSRALVTGNTGPDFIADFYFDATYVRPMPMYSIPGLIDHH